MKKYLLMTIIIMSALFLFPLQCAQGAKHGLLLWFNTIIPALFPFILITNLLKVFNGIGFFQRVFGKFLSFIFSCSKSGSYSIIIGFLCGYPMGAKAVADSYATGHITEDEADYLLCFCNNPSPMYMINYVFASVIGNTKTLPLFLIAVYVGSFLTALTCRFLFFGKTTSFKETKPISMLQISPSVLLDECLMNALSLIEKIGGYMILFSIINQLVFLLPINDFIKIIFCGFCEQTTGIHKAGLIASLHTKTVLTAAFTSFGGFAVMAQTHGLIGSLGLSMKKYIIGKTFHCIYTVIILYVCLIIWG